MLVNHFLVVVSLSLCTVSLRLSGLPVFVLTATSNLGSRSSHLSLIVHPELQDPLSSQVACLTLDSDKQKWDKLLDNDRY